MNAIDINIPLSQESKLGKKEKGTLYEPDSTAIFWQMFPGDFISIILQKDMITLMVFSVTDENVYFYLCLLVEITIFDKLFFAW